MHKYGVGIASGVLVAGLTGYILTDTFVISREQAEETSVAETTAYQSKTENKPLTTAPVEETEDEATEKKEEKDTSEQFKGKTYNSEFGGELKVDKDTDDDQSEDDYAYGYGNGNSQSDRSESQHRSDNWFDNYFEDYKKEYSNDEFSADWKEWLQREFGSDENGWSFYEDGSR